MALARILENKTRVKAQAGSRCGPIRVRPRVKASTSIVQSTILSRFNRRLEDEDKCRRESEQRRLCIWEPAQPQVHTSRAQSCRIYDGLASISGT